MHVTHMRVAAAGEDPNLLYSEDDIYHSYHDQDAIVVPRSCAHVLQGEEREKTVLWGRWQLRNETFGLFRCLSVGTDSFCPIFCSLWYEASVHTDSVVVLFVEDERRSGLAEHPCAFMCKRTRAHELQ